MPHLQTAVQCIEKRNGKERSGPWLLKNRNTGHPFFSCAQINPDNGEVIVIEMNPRVSRSSALASKATGFPIAKLAAKLSIGLALSDITNDITLKTPASFEPTLDYVVTKVLSAIDLQLQTVEISRSTVAHRSAFIVTTTGTEVCV